MKFDILKNDEKIQDWLDTIAAKPATERIYLKSMYHYTEWICKSPTELYNEAVEDIKAGLLPSERRLKRNIIRYRKHLNDQNLSPLTIRTYMSGVTNFYKAHDIEVPRIPRTELKAQPLEENCEIPKKEDLQEVLKICDPLEKAILLVGASSGLSAIDIVNLKVKNFKEGYDPETGITTLKLRREKTKFAFITFLSPEASRAVWDYINYRNRKHTNGDIERIKQIGKQNVTRDNGYLFICRRVPPEYEISHDEKLRKLEARTLQKIYRTISEESQKSTPRGEWNLIRSHNARKFFNSAMLNAGADSFHTEFFMGHTLDDTRAAYFRANPEKLRDYYQKYIPYLTIQKELDVSESPEYQRIKQENQILQKETARHVVERAELQQFRSELEMMKKIFNESEIVKDFTIKMEIVKDNLQKNKKVSRDDIDKDENP